jgi:hypothetical protein
VLLGREITEDVNGAYPDYTNGHGGNDNVLKIKNVPLNADGTSKFHMLVAAPYQTGAYSFDPMAAFQQIKKDHSVGSVARAPGLFWLRASQIVIGVPALDHLQARGKSAAT